MWPQELLLAVQALALFLGLSCLYWLIFKVPYRRSPLILALTAQWLRTIADGEWVIVEFDSEEELKLAETLAGIAVIRFGFFVRVVNDKIMELRDYIGIKNDIGSGGELDTYLCCPCVALAVE